ncbi:hypothetical protein [Actinopolymorpha cephalotaxi]|nr:hypothetical protein [Actinopolymorpha cephalotaxi]NYH86329.1 hypothetical protein [Actinopolymorpha cephalotaxi]
MDAHTWQYRNRAAAAGVEFPDDGPGDFDRGPMVSADLLSLPWPLVVVEGALVTPDLAGPSSNAVWLMPSQEEQRARLERRNPGEAHDGYLWGRQLIQDQLVAAPGAATIVVDNQTVGQTVAAVENHFAERIAAGPTARGARERQQLLRYANEVAVTHSMTGLARRHGLPDAGRLVRTFDCECAAPTCDALLDLSVSDAATVLAGPPPALLAPGHPVR